MTEGSVGFTPFLFQNGGDYYVCEDATSGFCKSSLNTPEALAGFQEWTELYSNYKIREANFFTMHRRQPMGIANYFTYIQHRPGAGNAPHARAPLRGAQQLHRDGDPRPQGTEPGTVIRTSGGTEAVVIFNQSTQKEKSWEFVKWWTGAGAQQRFGGELEALIGVEARWNTANLEALQASWPRRDIASSGAVALVPRAPVVSGVTLPGAMS